MRLKILTVPHVVSFRNRSSGSRTSWRDRRSKAINPEDVLKEAEADAESKKGGSSDIGSGEVDVSAMTTEERIEYRRKQRQSRRAELNL